MAGPPATDVEFIVPGVQNFQGIAPPGSGAVGSVPTTTNNQVNNLTIPPSAPPPAPVQWFPTAEMFAMGLNNFDVARGQFIQAGNLVNVFETVSPKELPVVLKTLIENQHAVLNATELTSNLQRRGLIFNNQRVVGVVNDRVYVWDSRLQ